MELKIANIDDIKGVAGEFLHHIGDCRHIAFHAGMGVGKTTFISALCEVLGMEDEASSPTFSIINEYHALPSDNQSDHAGSDTHIERIFHFDFYRIETPEETIDLGLDDYFDSGALCLMEWPENVESFLPEDTLDVYMEADEEGVRHIRWNEPKVQA